MTRRQRVLTILIPGLVIVGLLAYGFIRPADRASTDGPTFELPRLDAAGSLSSEDLRGDPVVLNFWASWCIPCREEMPAFEAVWQDYRDRGVHVVGVNVQDSEEAARAFMREIGVTYPIVIDEKQTLLKELQIGGLPQTFFLGPDYTLAGSDSGPSRGRRRGTIQFGAVSEELLRRRIEELLDE